VAGSPATTVILGVTGIFGADSPPDLIVSGTNEGANLGPATPISGTVGATIAAIQTLAEPIPAIAVSTNLIAAEEEPDSPANTEHFRQVGDFVARLVERLQRGGCGCGNELLPGGIALNVNYPPLAPEEVKGVKLRVQGQAPFFAISFQPVAPGLFAPGFGPVDPENDVPRSDTKAFNEGYITIVPIDGDYTADQGRLRWRLRGLGRH
jgi:5'/3'-nucleotidase SurE